MLEEQLQKLREERQEMFGQLGQKREVLETRLKEELKEQVARGQKEIQEARKELKMASAREVELRAQGARGQKEVLEKKQDAD